MDIPEAGTGSMTGHFQDGHDGNPYRVASSLNEVSSVFSQQVPGNFTPQSVLNAQKPSSNGMSGTDYSRMLLGGTVLPSANGSDPKSYEAAKYMNYIGEFAR